MTKSPYQPLYRWRRTKKCTTMYNRYLPHAIIAAVGLVAVLAIEAWERVMG